jgi:hypothetical protein
VSEAEILEQGKTTAIKWHPIMFHFYIHANQQSLLQKSFVVSVSNLFSISASLADTIYTILKIAYFLYRMLPTDTKNRFFFKKETTKPDLGLLAQIQAMPILPHVAVLRGGHRCA